MTQKSVKMVFNKLTKIFLISDMTSFEVLVQKVKTKFKKLSGQFNIYYYDDQGSYYEIEQQDDLQTYLDEQIKYKLHVKLQGEGPEPFQSILNTTILNRSIKEKTETVNSSTLSFQRLLQEKHGDAKSSQVRQQLNPRSNASSIIKKDSESSNVRSTTTINQLIQNSAQKTQKVEIDNEQSKENTIKRQSKQSLSEIKPKMKEESKPFKSEIVEQKIEKKGSRIEDSKKIVHKTNCNQCKSQSITGNRWKCLQCFDVDLCEKCYNNRKTHIDHDFVLMDAQDYLKKINYKTSISKLFNPNYKQQKSSVNRQISPWISEDDIINNKIEAVDQIWKASEGLSKRMLNYFRQWDDKWSVSSKS